MSVTVSAAPISLLFSIVAPAIATGTYAIATGTYATASGIYNSIKDGMKSGNHKLHLEKDEIEKAFIDKSFDTTIMDKEALIKTLKEHGADNIKENENNIECNCQYFHLKFIRENSNNPYKLTITANENKGIDEFATDISNEYTLNAQEISYNKIKERLKAQNLEIADEEIYDDNTIVLTVNLED